MHVADYCEWMTWDKEIRTIPQLAKQVPRAGFGCLDVSGSPGRAPGPGGTCGFPPGPGPAPPAWAAVEMLRESRKTKGMALKIMQGSKKTMGSFIRIAVVLDHIVNDLFNLNIFHKESPYFHKYVIST